MQPAMLDSLSFPVSLGLNGRVTEKIRGNHVHFSDESYPGAGQKTPEIKQDSDRIKEL